MWKQKVLRSLVWTICWNTKHKKRNLLLTTTDRFSTVGAHLVCGLPFAFCWERQSSCEGEKARQDETCSFAIWSFSALKKKTKRENRDKKRSKTDFPSAKTHPVIVHFIQQSPLLNSEGRWECWDTGLVEINNLKEKYSPQEFVSLCCTTLSNRSYTSTIQYQTISKMML